MVRRNPISSFPLFLFSSFPLSVGIEVDMVAEGEVLPLINPLIELRLYAYEVWLDSGYSEIISVFILRS